jgi:hypothetical protein
VPRADPERLSNPRARAIDTGHSRAARRQAHVLDWEELIQAGTQ